ncbi:3-hydroxybutyryl-CoA dehydrogenase [bacterium]|nr:3-hydroxybutyryl-CoA dehydrogenase [bacterium]
MSISKFGVVGTGTMGNGIAQVAGQTGLDVVAVDIKQDFLDRAKGTIEKNLGRMVKKEKLTQDQADAALGNINFTTDYDALKDRELIVEAATENPDIKFKVFKQLDELAPEGTILASNTSTISITEIAAHTNRTDKVIGMHFMNPVPMMKLVEVIRGLATSDETYAAVDELSKTMGKVPIVVNDYPGFVANRILMPMINEAVYALMEGVGGVAEIDGVMKLGMAHPMGPLRLADLIGNDVCLAIMEVLHSGLGDSKYRPCPLLRKMVAGGFLGNKTGVGFYDYREDPRNPVARSF